jgi:trk system potassium uptake protein TrkH
MISIIVITTSLSLNSVYATFGDTLRSSIFQVASIISTTGYATADFSTWPLFAQMILVLLMFIGGCAGSTGGGLKVSRVIILFKSGANEIKKVLSPRRVVLMKFEDKILDATVHHGVLRYFSIYSLIFFLSLILISVGSAGTTNNFATNFSAVTSCLNNIGPGLASIGPIGNYSEFNVFAKIILSLDMLIGRLEIFPILILFYPKLWLHK